MKLFSFSILFIVFLSSCKDEPVFESRDLSEVQLKTILTDSTLSIRAIEILDINNLAFAANNNTFGLYNFQKKDWLLSKQSYDSLAIEFRSVGNNNQDFFMLSVGSPALLFKTSDSKMELAYTELHEKAFYDSMDFWNQQEGIAIGDSTDGCLSIIITRDGGNTWTKLTCDQLPKGLEDEGAFAASDTNIAIVGDKTWVATTAGRIYFSPDKGKTWQVFDTPIVKEKETEGIYSMDFYDELNGFAIGGDYTKPDDNSANKILTHDGGKTWQLVAQNQDPGYRSCVQYIPGRSGKELVAIGFKGIDYSKDGGYNWKHLSDEGFYTIRFLNDSVAFAAGQGRVSKLTFKE